MEGLWGGGGGAEACNIKHAASNTLPVRVTESDAALWACPAGPAALGRDRRLPWKTASISRACGNARRFRPKAATSSCSVSSPFCGFPTLGQGDAPAPEYVRQRLSANPLLPA